MSRAIVKNRYPKKIGRSKLYDKKINTKLEKRIKQIAQAEVDKNKKQKVHVRILMGRLQVPTISAETAQGDDNNYTCGQMVGHQIVCRDGLKNDVGTPFNGQNTVKRNIFMFPQLRMSADNSLGNFLGGATKVLATNDTVCYYDYDEVGDVRSNDEIMLKGFKISGEFVKNPRNLQDEVEVQIAVYKVNAEYTMNQRDAQYLLPHSDQSTCMPKRLIRDILGSDINTGQPKYPDTEQIKQRVLYKKWTFRPRQELYLTADAANVQYNERKINFSIYCEQNQKIKFARGVTGANAITQKSSNDAVNTNINTHQEYTDKYEGVKYCCVIKSNIMTADSANKAPSLTCAVTSYWTDITS